MPRHLILMRHAHAHPAIAHQSDADRPLSADGQRTALSQANWLMEQGFLPEAALCSPARRTTETAEIVWRHLGLDWAALRFDGRIYEASAGKLLQVIQRQSAATACLLLVGHNPGIEQLLCVLTGRGLVELTEGRGCLPATVAVLQLADAVADWSAVEMGCASLVARSLPTA